jgi:hypothetical protein
MAKRLSKTEQIYKAVDEKLRVLREDFRGLVALVDNEAIVKQLRKMRINHWVQNVQLDVAGEKMWGYTATNQSLAVKIFPCSYSKMELDIYDPELSLVYPMEKRLIIPEFQIIVNGIGVKKLYESVDSRMEKRTRAKGTGQDE